MTAPAAGQGISVVPGVPGMIVGGVPGGAGVPGITVEVPFGPGITMSGVPGEPGVPGITVPGVPGVAGIRRHREADRADPTGVGLERLNASAILLASSLSGVCTTMSNCAPLSSSTSFREVTSTCTV